MEDKKIGVLFDLDGVLVDSEGEYSDFWGPMGRRFNVPSPTFAADIKGTTLGEILLAFPEEAREGIVNELHDYEKAMKYPWIPGAEKFIESLLAQDIPFAIVTSSDDVKMSYLFAAHPELRDKLTALVTGSMVHNSKPDPEGYLTGAKLIGVPIEDCYVFEDSMQGLEAGRRSGATVIGLSTTNSREKISDKADMVIDSFEGFDTDKMRKVTRG
ncbi:MAG: HAD-IA family hydrolase [Duncaniella sp.]|uniref:HAD family hydrolase n=1 Tax=Duncaniella sp. TaxID=2518496 RepID=UPI0019AED14A|nr:HAD-IA family hydrolase [Duncaniella sp.]MBD5314542.1 HAD-IA family hydrolase [Bacteroides sp.]MDE6090930.1 HAD-IA family hydrolase [Duncaniella sp.]